MSKVVRVIPSTIDPMTQLPVGSKEKIKVAAYARVSTNTDEQYTSYDAQVNYYRDYIQERADWTFVNVYADEGITGTNTKRRTGFNHMINDALDGKINLIITKSISRFARNTLDTISFVRKLKEKGIEVFFEKENLWTLDPKSELILTIMASIAQEESRSISQNVTWGKRVGFQQGKVSFAYSRFLGYEKIGDKIKIVEPEAEVVRSIYRMFLVEGKTATGIAIILKDKGVKTPSGKTTNWTKNTVNSILTNEKYKGDALLQKTYTDNYLEQSIVKNQGQIPQYYVENNHPAIIDKDMWEQVQIELDRRKKIGAKYSSSDIFASKIICSDCGGFYGKKKWHSNSKYSRFVYQCNNKFHKDKTKCMTPNLNEDEIKLKFVQSYNIVMEDKERIMGDLKLIISSLTDTSILDNELNQVKDEMVIVTELVSKLIQENAKTNMSLEEYNLKYANLVERYNKLQKKQDSILDQMNKRRSQEVKMKVFVNNLEKINDKVSEWNENIWNLVVEHATVHRDSNMTFKFISGLETKTVD